VKLLNIQNKNNLEIGPCWHDLLRYRCKLTLIGSVLC